MRWLGRHSLEKNAAAKSREELSPIIGSTCLTDIVQWTTSVLIDGRHKLSCVSKRSPRWLTFEIPSLIQWIKSTITVGNLSGGRLRAQFQIHTQTFHIQIRQIVVGLYEHCRVETPNAKHVKLWWSSFWLSQKFTINHTVISNGYSGFIIKFDTF